MCNAVHHNPGSAALYIHSPGGVRLTLQWRPLKLSKNIPLSLAQIPSVEPQRWFVLGRTQRDTIAPINIRPPPRRVAPLGISSKTIQPKIVAKTI